MNKFFFSLLLIFISIKNVQSSEDIIDIYALAMAADSELMQVQLGYEIALETKRQNFSKLLPSISISGDKTANSQKRTYDASQFDGEESYNSYGYSLSINQPLFRQTNIINAKQDASRIHQAKAELMIAKQNLIIKLAERYFDVLAAQDNMRFIISEKKAVKRQLVQAESRLKAGLTTVTGVYEAQAQLDSTKADEIIAQYQYTNSLESLKEITNQNHDKIKSLAKSLILSKPSPSGRDKWEALAFENNFEMISLRHTNQVLRHDIKREKANHYPTLDLVARYSKMTSGGGSFGQSDTETRTIALQFNLPVYQGGLTNSRVKGAILKYEQNIKKLDSLHRMVRKQVYKNYTGIIASIATAKSQQQSVASNEKALKAIKAGNIAGLRTTSDIFLATGKLYRAQRDYERARYDYILNTLRLKKIAGTLSFADLEQVNLWLN